MSVRSPCACWKPTNAVGQQRKAIRRGRSGDAEGGRAASRTWARCWANSSLYQNCDCVVSDSLIQCSSTFCQSDGSVHAQQAKLRTFAEKIAELSGRDALPLGVVLEGLEALLLRGSVGLKVGQERKRVAREFERRRVLTHLAGRSGGVLSSAGANLRSSQHATFATRSTRLWPLRHAAESEVPQRDSPASPIRRRIGRIGRHRHRQPKASVGFACTLK